jgi:hypothetical protein
MILSRRETGAEEVEEVEDMEGMEMISTTRAGSTIDTGTTSTRVARVIARARKTPVASGVQAAVTSKFVLFIKHLQIGDA